MNIHDMNCAMEIRRSSETVSIWVARSHIIELGVSSIGVPHPNRQAQRGTVVYVQKSKKQVERNVAKLLNLTKYNIRNFDKVQ